MRGSNLTRKRTTIKLRDDKPRRNPYSSAPPTAKESRQGNQASKEHQQELFSSRATGDAGTTDGKRNRWKSAGNKAKGQNIMENAVSAIFNPMLARARAYVHIIVAGERFKTTRATVNQYPKTLLSSKDNKYWDEERKALVFPNQCRLSFDNILYFYQSRGLLACPPNISMDRFKEECRFFKIPQECLDRCEHGVVLDMVLEMEQEEDQPTSLFTIWRKKVMAPGGFRKKLLGGIDMVATVVFVMMLMLMTHYSDPNGVKDHHVERDKIATNVLSYLSTICVLWFVIHYSINILSTNDKKRYCLGLLSLIDFLVVGSFIVDICSKHANVDQKIKDTITNVRILIGVARQLCLARYSTLLYCLGTALVKSGKDLLHILYILMIVILVFSSAAFFFETESGLHIVDEEVLWHKVQQSFEIGANESVFKELASIVNEDNEFKVELEGPYIIRNENNSNYTDNHRSFTSVINWEMNFTNLTRSKLGKPAKPDDCRASLHFHENESYISNKTFSQYIEDDNFKEYMNFVPIIYNTTLQMLIIEDYIVMNLTSWEVTVEINSRFVSIPASLWWGFITITTVGYGDLAPRTTWGKLISATLALTGIPLIAIPLPLIMNKFTQLYKAKKYEDKLEEKAAKLLKERAAKKKKEEKEEKDAATEVLRNVNRKRFEKQNYVIECDENNGASLTCHDKTASQPWTQKLRLDDRGKPYQLSPETEERTTEECDVRTESNAQTISNPWKRRLNEKKNLPITISETKECTTEESDVTPESNAHTLSNAWKKRTSLREKNSLPMLFPEITECETEDIEEETESNSGSHNLSPDREDCKK